MRHFRALQRSLFNRPQAGLHLIFIPADLFGGIVGSNHVPGAVIDPDALTVVDVLHLYKSIVTIDDAPAVAESHCAAAQNRHPAILIGDGDAVLSVHAGLCHHRGAGYGVHLIPKHHRRKIKRVDSHIQKGSSCQLRTHNTLFSADDIAQVGREHIWPAYDAA